jgi:hypothetical protein
LNGVQSGAFWWKSLNTMIATLAIQTRTNQFIGTTNGLGIFDKSFGWWEAIKIPLQPHPDGGLLVTDHLRMEQSVTLACSLDYYQELDSGFEPPVPIHAYQRLYGKQYLVEEEEGHIKDPPTLKDYHLLYASNFLAGFDDLYPIEGFTGMK